MNNNIPDSLKEEVEEKYPDGISLSNIKRQAYIAGAMSRDGVKKINLYSFSLDWHGFVLQLHHQGGSKLKYENPGIDDEERKSYFNMIATEATQFIFSFNRLFEVESDFKESYFSSQITQYKKSFDNSISLIRFFREYNIIFMINAPNEDYDLLRKVSPPLYDYVDKARTALTSVPLADEDEVWREVAEFLGNKLQEDDWHLAQLKQQYRISKK